jgi:hypothetical protein
MLIVDIVSFSDLDIFCGFPLLSNSFCILLVTELDGMMGDTMVEIVDYESRILLKLVQFIQERIAPLHKLIKLTSELDW